MPNSLREAIKEFREIFAECVVPDRALEWMFVTGALYQLRSDKSYKDSGAVIEGGGRVAVKTR